MIHVIERHHHSPTHTRLPSFSRDTRTIEMGCSRSGWMHGCMNRWMVESGVDWRGKSGLAASNRALIREHTSSGPSSA